jgi:hypothetical protein
MAEVVAAQEGETDWLDRLAEGVIQSSDQTWESEEPSATEPEEEPIVVEVEEPEPEPEKRAAKPERVPSDLKGVAAPASTTLTDGVYDEIRRLRSRVGDK